MSEVFRVPWPGEKNLLQPSFPNRSEMASSRPQRRELTSDVITESGNDRHQHANGYCFHFSSAWVFPKPYLKRGPFEMRVYLWFRLRLNRKLAADGLKHPSDSISG